jgi:hypothetical protein
MSNIERIIIAAIILLIGGFIWVDIRESTLDKRHPCLQSHVETQYEAPVGVVVGGGKYGGGVSIPIENLKPKQVTVCDIRS